MFVSQWVLTFFITNFQSWNSTGSHQVTFHPNGHDLVGHLGGDHGLLCRFSFREVWFLFCPKDPDMSSERDFPYIPIVGMGLRHQSYSREGSGFLGLMNHFFFGKKGKGRHLMCGEKKGLFCMNEYVYFFVGGKGP